MDSACLIAHINFGGGRIPERTLQIAMRVEAQGKYHAEVEEANNWRRVRVICKKAETESALRTILAWELEVWSLEIGKLNGDGSCLRDRSREAEDFMPETATNAENDRL